MSVSAPPRKSAPLAPAFPGAPVRGVAAWPLPLPTKRAAGLLAACAALVLGGWFHPLVAGAGACCAFAVLVCVVADFLACPRPADVQAERVPVAVTGLGTPEEFVVRLRRLADGEPTAFRARDDLAFGLERAREFEDGMLPAAGRVEVATAARSTRRGRLALGAFHLRFLGAMGLAERQARFDVPAELRVLPRYAEGSAAARVLRRGLRLEMGLRRARRRGEGTSFESLREHSPGEDIRRIDWKASARHAKLIQRHYEMERSQCLVLLVDCGRAMTAEIAGTTRLDHVLDACVLLAQAAALRDDRIGVLAFSDRIERFVPPSKGRAAVERIVDAVFDLEPRLVEPDYERAFAYLSARHRRRSLLVLFTDVMSREASRIVGDEMRRAVRRHVPLAVALRDVDLDAVARGVPSGASAAYELAAAEELLLERDAAIARMKRDGVQVLDTDPRHAAVSAVDRYLEIKARLVL